MALADEMAYGLAQLIDVQGGSVTYTNVTTLPGTNPAPNPPTAFVLTVDGTTAMGLSAINLKAQILTGRLIIGDKFTIAGDTTVYTVGAQVLSPLATPTLPGVTFTPPLAMSEADGSAVALYPKATFSIAALITDFPAILVNGTSIQSKDHKIRVLASSLPSGVIPNIGDLVTLPDGEIQKVIRISHMEVQGVHYGYALQVRA